MLWVLAYRAADVYNLDVYSGRILSAAKGELLMFGRFGMGELLIILVIVLVVFGPKKLPEIGKSLGEAIRQFKGATESDKKEEN